MTANYESQSDPIPKRMKASCSLTLCTLMLGVWSICMAIATPAIRADRLVDLIGRDARRGASSRKSVSGGDRETATRLKVRLLLQRRLIPSEEHSES